MLIPLLAILKMVFPRFMHEGHIWAPAPANANPQAEDQVGFELRNVLTARPRLRLPRSPRTVAGTAQPVAPAAPESPPTYNTNDPNLPSYNESIIDPDILPPQVSNARFPSRGSHR